MAYRGKNTHEQNRTVGLGRVPLEAGHPLLDLRERTIEARNAFVAAAWSLDLLESPKADGPEPLLKVQSAMRDRLQTAWGQKARVSAQVAVKAKLDRARAMFVGRLSHLAGPGCLRQDLFEDLVEEGGAGLFQGLADLAGKDCGVLWSMAAASEGSPSNPGVVGEILAWLRSQVVDRFGAPPVFAAEPERFTAGIPLDVQNVRKKPASLPVALERLGAAIVPAVRTGKPQRVALALAPIQAGGTPLAMEAVLHPGPLLALAPRSLREDREAVLAWLSGQRVRALMLEIGPKHAELRAVLARPEAASADSVLAARKDVASRRKAVTNPKPKDDPAVPAAKLAEALAREAKLTEGFTLALRDAKAVIGIDTGKKTPGAATVLAAPGGVDPVQALSLASQSGLGDTPGERKTLKAWLSEHSLPQPQVIDTLLLGAQAAIAHLEKQADAIASASRRIDAVQRRLAKCKAAVNLLLGRAFAARLPDAFDELMAEPGVVARKLDADHRSRALSWFCAFRRRLRQAQVLKAERLDLWRRVAALVQCWHGFAANRIVDLAIRHQAVVAVEVSDWGVIGKEEGGYRGKAWNRIVAMLAPGKMKDRLQAKLDWSGVASWGVASPWTSRTDHRHAVAHVSQRPDGSDTFTALADGSKTDADLHAAETQAAMVLMRPLDEAGRKERDRILKTARPPRTSPPRLAA